MAVVARFVGTSDQHARAVTRSDGRYLVRLPEFGEAYHLDVTAEPPDALGLMPARVLGQRVGPLEEIALDFRLFAHSSRIEGRVVDQGGQPVRGVEVWSIPSGGIADLVRPDAGLEQWILSDVIHGSGDTAVTDDSGRFVFLGHARGPHRLFAGHGPWMIHPQSEVWSGTTDVVLHGRERSRGAYVIVDIETEEPLPRAVVRVAPLPEGANERAFWDHFVEWKDRHINQRYGHVGMDPHLTPWVNVEAAAIGYEHFRMDRSFTADRKNVALALGLMTPRLANVRLEVMYDDGTLVRDALAVAFHRAGRTAVGGFHTRPSPTGHHDVGLPPGSWTVHVWPASAGLPDMRSFGVDVPREGSVRVEVTMPRCASLCVELPEKPAGLDWVVTAIWEVPRRFRARSFFLVQRETTLEQLPPGPWRFLVRRGTDIVTERAFTLKPGDRETVTVQKPPPAR